MVVTHGDADHFAGLSEIVAPETNKDPASGCSRIRSACSTTAS